MKKLLQHALSAHGMFVIIALFFGLVYVHITPPLWGFDEPSHFTRVYQITHGEIIPHTDPKNFAGTIPTNMLLLQDYRNRDMLDNPAGDITVRKDVNNINGYKQFTDSKFSNTQQPFPFIASYVPIAYVGPLTGVIVADTFNATVGQTLLIARVASLLSYIGIVFLALWLLRNSKSKWLIFTVALLPSSLFQASTVTADTATTGLSILFMAIFIRLMQAESSQKDKMLFYMLSAVAILLPIVKINYILLSAALLLIPNRVFKSTKVAITAKFMTIFAAIICSVAWLEVSQSTTVSPISQRPDGLTVDPAQQLSLLIDYPIHLFTVMARSMVNVGDTYFTSMLSVVGPMPSIFIALLSIVLFIATVYAKNEFKLIKNKVLLLNVLALMGITSIFLALYLAFTPVGSKMASGVQGRYFLPFLIPALIMIGILFPIEVNIRRNIAPLFFGVISTICLLASTIYYWAVLY